MGNLLIPLVHFMLGDTGAATGAPRHNVVALVNESPIMTFLQELDKVAYVRFASVYRDFKDVNDFVIELKTLLSNH